MAIEDADGSDSPALDGDTGEAASGSTARVGEYTWDDYLREYGHEEAAEDLYSRFAAAPGSDRWGESEEDTRLGREDWDRTDLDATRFLGFHPADIDAEIEAAAGRAKTFHEAFESFCDPETTPVAKGEYFWEHYKREYYYEADGSRPRDASGAVEPFDRSEALGFDADRTENALAAGGQKAAELAEVVDERTVNVSEELDEDAFFSTAHGTTTLVNRYDLEKAVPLEKKTHFEEMDRYWANKPYSFVVIFRSTKENEIKYYAIQPYMNRIEDELQEFLTGKLRTSIKYSDESVAGESEDHRKGVIADETYRLLDRYDLYEPGEADPQLGNKLADALGFDPREGIGGKLVRALGYEPQGEGAGELEGIEVRPEGKVVEEDPETLTEYQVEKLLYYLKRDFIGYERIDPIKYDINVEDISCDGYNSPVFVYHSDYEQIITNIYHGEKELDDFVVKMAQRSGKGISKRSPQVDCSLPDGSRAQLTLGQEVSDHGTNYTIRQFKEVPFTPVDLINWRTFSLDEMAFLWLCIENHKSLIFAGGTASGKTTSLNAVSLFIPSNTKIVSIEDTREVELPQRNWIASVTRPSFSDDDKGDVDEFDLLEAALRQRPDYIVMGEIRGEEGRTAFQVMSTGHTTYTTFHADSVGEVLKRFTTEPINVSKTMFTALDLVSIQAATRVDGHKVKRNKSLTEINHYDAENDEINVQDVFQWQAETDEFLQMGDSNTLEEIKFDRGWNQQRLEDEMFKRRVVLAYLIKHGLNTYTQVAATFQAFINDPETILALMANDELERSLEDLREMESVHINVDPEKEEMVPRPDPDEDGLAEAEAILAEAEELFEEYRGEMPDDVADALMSMEPEGTVEAEPEKDYEALEEAAAEAAELAEGESAPELAGDDDGGADATPALEAGDDGATPGAADDDATPEPPDDSGATPADAGASPAGDEPAREGTADADGTTADATAPSERSAADSADAADEPVDEADPFAPADPESADAADPESADAADGAEPADDDGASGIDWAEPGVDADGFGDDVSADDTEPDDDREAADDGDGDGGLDAADVFEDVEVENVDEGATDGGTEPDGDDGFGAFETDVDEEEDDEDEEIDDWGFGDVADDEEE